MGIRLIDEFLANARITKCGDFKETAENIAKVRSHGAYAATLLAGRTLAALVFLVRISRQPLISVTYQNLNVRRWDSRCF